MNIIPAACIGRAIVVDKHGCLPDPIMLALHLTGLTVTTVNDIRDIQSGILALRPDVVVITELDYTDERAAFEARCPRIEVVESDILAESPSPQTLRLSSHVTTDVAYLTIRSLLRRERTGLLLQERRSGSLTLQEDTFCLIHDGKRAKLAKSDVCLLGPFFDVHDAVMDRETLWRLISGDYRKPFQLPLFNARLGRVRRNIIREIGHDPLRTIHTLGCALNNA